MSKIKAWLASVCRWIGMVAEEFVRYDWEESSGIGHAARPTSPPPPVGGAPRPAVQWFAKQMESKLAVNDHKGGWTGWPVQEALWKLEEELDELHNEVVELQPDPERIAKEAADVANVAMMIADMYRGCPDGPQGKGEPG